MRYYEVRCTPILRVHKMYDDIHHGTNDTPFTSYNKTYLLIYNMFVH